MKGMVIEFVGWGFIMLMFDMCGVGRFMGWFLFMGYVEV